MSRNPSVPRSTSTSSDSITSKPRTLVNINGLVMPQVVPGEQDDFNADVNHDSFRVTYYDPGQQAAKKRLMALLESEVEDVASDEVRLEVAAAEEREKGRRMIPTRRSTRMAGF
ncbi:hypothetical protein BS47DRAFT_1340342 [Hydnum rufescens UP504]|uniref:Uncharacterized protein n=1 Tax=Hydnum rufescens UP504 TaxID=1448309 RepID=A0A9P6B3X3_9AGAM|nr:hypothetical protein BS47DRAFT_1340342 [Hydnum rufescens UP504]